MPRRHLPCGAIISNVNLLTRSPTPPKAQSVLAGPRQEPDRLSHALSLDAGRRAVLSRRQIDRRGVWVAP